MSEIKKFAEEYYLEYWKSPSTSEIAGAVGVTRATVYRYLKDMSERGMIDYDGSEIKTDVTRKYTDPGNNAVILSNSQEDIEKFKKAFFKWKDITQQ